MSDERIFQEALSNFTFDFANGGAIRHLADLNYSANEIAQKLEFHGSFYKLQKAVWDYYLKSGKIRTEEPGKNEGPEKVTYVKETGKYGRRTFRKVVEKNENTIQTYHIISFKDYVAENPMHPEISYAKCEFGKIKKESPDLFDQICDSLTDRDREFMMGLLWEEAEIIFYRLDSRMIRILKALEQANIYSTDIWRN